uniref:Syndecan/Neurexin domain-containing protein n=1 Tax=Dicentrarchus labrax TaxID=13489 RepID=A0A8C4F9J1_DICLA
MRNKNYKIIHFIHVPQHISCSPFAASPGVTLAVALAAILIYKWHKEDDGGYILGEQSDEDYHKPNREEVVV